MNALSASVADGLVHCRVHAPKFAAHRLVFATEVFLAALSAVRPERAAADGVTIRAGPDLAFFTVSASNWS